ncbi:MAG: ferritin family protein [Bacteroidota bacterium]
MTHRNDQLDWEAMSVEDILRLAIADEEEARAYYRTAAERVGGIHTRRMLMRLAEMEAQHAAELRKELQDILLQRDEETGIAD